MYSEIASSKPRLPAFFQLRMEVQANPIGLNPLRMLYEFTQFSVASFLLYHTGKVEGNPRNKKESMMLAMVALKAPNAIRSNG